MNHNNHTAVMPVVSELDYPLEWLDQLINVSLNPERLNPRSVLVDDVRTIAERLDEEDAKLQLLIKKQVFSLVNIGDIENLIQSYHHSLVLLQKQTLSYQKKLLDTNATAFELYKVIVDNIDKTLTFVETYFSTYLTPDQLVPSNVLNEVRRNLRDRLKTIKTEISSAEQPIGITKLVFGRIQDFISNDERISDVSLRAVQYRRELMFRLENIPIEPSPEEGFSLIDKVLIYMNFNSKSYIQKLTKFLAKKIRLNVDEDTQLETLRFYYKAFKQIQRNNQLIYNPENPTLDEVMENWFDQELNYRQVLTKGTDAAIESSGLKSVEPDVGDQMKLLCNLSGDQIALILRAADEAKIVAATSMAEVFKNIVPFLATKRKKELSYNSLRSKSYNAEEKDKDVAIEALKRMIRKIEDY